MPHSAATPSDPTAKPAKKVINLALQGGGSHGAFAWGVLDRLLADDRLEIEGIVGTSAGAMNAAVCAYGLEKGGPAEASKVLGEFWGKISQAAAKGPLKPLPFEIPGRRGTLDYLPAFIAMDMMSKILSPYQLNPMNVNPLRDVLAETVDF